MGGERWINTNTTVYVNATDESGVDWTHYEVWKDADGDDVFETLEKMSPYMITTQTMMTLLQIFPFLLP